MHLFILSVSSHGAGELVGGTVMPCPCAGEPDVIALMITKQPDISGRVLVVVIVHLHQIAWRDGAIVRAIMNDCG